jgi:hypothetical protein
MSKHDGFQRSTPYRPADAAIAARATPVAPGVPVAQGRSPLWMVAFCALFLVAGLGIGLFAMSRTNRGEAKNQDKEENKDAWKKPTRITSPPLDDRLAKGLGEKDLPGVSLPEKDSSAGRLQAPEKQPGSPLNGGKVTSQPGKPPVIPEAVSEALGGLTVSHLYQTYLNIGLLADAYENQVYEKEEAKDTLDTVSGLMSDVEKQLDRVARQTKDDEKKFVDQARAVMASLRTQTRELQSYWDSGEKDHVTKFHQARKDSWNGIKELLNIQD